MYVNQTEPNPTASNSAVNRASADASLPIQSSFIGVFKSVCIMCQTSLSMLECVHMYEAHSSVCSGVLTGGVRCMYHVYVTNVRP